MSIVVIEPLRIAEIRWPNCRRCCFDTRKQVGG